MFVILLLLWADFLVLKRMITGIKGMSEKNSLPYFSDKATRPASSVTILPTWGPYNFLLALHFQYSSVKIQQTFDKQKMQLCFIYFTSHICYCDIFRLFETILSYRSLFETLTHSLYFI